MKRLHFGLASLASLSLAACAAPEEGTTTPPDESTKSEESIPCPFAETKDWKSWHDTMPGSTPTLYITGTVTVGCDGYGPTLTFKSLDKKLPPNVNVELTLTEQEGAVAGEQEARCEMEAAAPEYDMMKIMCGDEVGFTGKIDQTS